MQLRPVGMVLVGLRLRVPLGCRGSCRLSRLLFRGLGVGLGWLARRVGVSMECLLPDITSVDEVEC